MKHCLYAVWLIVGIKTKTLNPMRDLKYLVPYFNLLQINHVFQNAITALYPLVSYYQERIGLNRFQNVIFIYICPIF